MVAMIGRQHLSNLLSLCETSYLVFFLSSPVQLLIIDHSTGISCRLLGGKLKEIFMCIYMYVFIRDRAQRKFVFNHYIRHLSNRLINVDEHLTLQRQTLLLFLYIFSHVYQNGSLYIRPFRIYQKSLHAGTFVCRAENAAGSIQTTPIQLKPRE